MGPDHCPCHAAGLEAPDGRHLEALTPHLYFEVEPGAREVRLQFTAQGERHKGATLYDSQGGVAGALSEFVDYGDEKPHTYDLTVKVPAGTAGGREPLLWALELQSVRISRAEGVLPFYSTSPGAYFRPRSATPTQPAGTR